MPSRIRTALLCAALAAPGAASAQEARAEADASQSKFRQYLEASSLRANLETGRDGFRAGAHGQIDAIAAQLQQELPELPAELLAESVRDGKAMVDEAIDSWDIDDALREYAEVFERNYPGGEMDAVLVLLRSEEGHKLETTVRYATSDMESFIQMRQNDAAQRQIMRFMRQLLLRIAEFEAARK